MENEEQKRLESYNEHIKIVNKNIAINEKFRQISIITFCVMGFVVSIAIQKEYSLFLFLASITLNFLTYYFGELSCLQEKKDSYEYYIKQKTEYFVKKNIYSKLCYHLNIISPLCCILGLLSLI
jgi:uncharacterized membrane protein YiaA